jgi:hypothetical protein
MVRVSIDVAAANGVVASMRGFVDEVVDEWSTVSTSARNGLCSVAPLRALSDPLENVRRLAGELTTRVELAVLYNTGGDGGFSTQPVLSYEVSDDTLDAVKAQLGVQIAEGLRDVAPGNSSPDRSDIERFEHYTTLMGKYADDPVVTDALFDELGPQGVIEVPIMLKDLAAAYSRDLGAKSDHDLMWDADTHMLDRIAELQQGFLESFGEGLATSTHSDAFTSAHPDFAEELAAVATEGRNGEGWGLSQVLRFGDYEPGFLTSVGTGLYEFEKDQVGPVWGTQAGGEVQYWRLGTEDNGGHDDPFVGLFEAMGRVPVAALDFFNPDGGGSGAQERSEYFITDRTWRADDFNALGLALDAAATGFHTSTAPVELQERAAWVASATVHYLAEREPGMHDRRIGDAGKDSLAHILSTYIYDVDRVANGESGRGLGTHPSNQNAPWDVGLPIGADFSQEDLLKVLNETLTDEGAAAQLGEATATWNGYRVAMAADAWGGEGSDSSRLQAAVNRGSRLTGFILGAMDTGVTGEAKAADEQAKTYLSFASDVVGLVPTGGTFTSFLADQAVSAGSDALTSHFTGNESRVAGEQHTVREVAYTDLEIALAVALAEADKLSVGAQTNEAGATYAWFQRGAFDADSLADPAVRNDFISWLGSGDGGETMTRLLPDIAAEFDRGVDRGSAGGR